MKSLRGADQEMRRACTDFSIGEGGQRSGTVGRYTIEYFGNGGSSPAHSATNFYVKRIGAQDDPLTDYFAGSFCKTLTAAIRRAQSWTADWVRDEAAAAQRKAQAEAEASGAAARERAAYELHRAEHPAAPPIEIEVERCPVCNEPGHPVDTDDLGRHSECQPKEEAAERVAIERAQTITEQLRLAERLAIAVKSAGRKPGGWLTDRREMLALARAVLGEKEEEKEGAAL